MAKSTDAIYKTIGMRIKDERKRRQLSQESLAELANVDRTHMGFIEQGRRRPTITTLYKIAKALNMSLESLFRGL